MSTTRRSDNERDKHLTETYGKLTRQDIPDIVHKCQEVS